MAASHPIMIGAPIRLTKKTSASASTPRISPTSVGSMYTGMRPRISKIQNAGLSVKRSMNSSFTASGSSSGRPGGMQA